ncbi:MAG: NAD-dependent epimerase/dehydratase family protein, partial [Rhodospirillales bacterium]
MAVQGVRPAGSGPDTKNGGFDVAVLGGTGFIGARVVRRFLAAGLRVGVTARNPANLAPLFDDESVTLIRGD